ncbi:AAA family ATPase [Curtobacterium flaccumfaciens pv. flaccumfaciens]|uniref:helix-turn-helix transcriptional regulator n=1 Tax=Curtobacterium TaxID=2034 RepID=UPI000DA9DE48|nr:MULTISPECIES: AAA family ATPase [Curtobacterium]MBO9046078.1 AAA family ATPase [Curtobacterium flaccumfaciens pv. flaccumfaciens]PZF44628.1 helix-turn-helix transcriptional regulator [Curtobacterium sp. MCLR17_053]PZF52709.1 helix-turn-helix transcriptional regulator [Curtobacterium sp. MCLR17_051]QTR90767.1 AAA family ATPase [Curtobacterium flaccumfaciens pv. flaccumfaciens]QVG66087.1 AAA family ATPase [Curtobacterium flaccumfaciens pv. flaccumfaciens]
MAATLLIGRDAHVAAVHDSIEAAAEGRGSGLLMIGDPGIGKSALAEVTARSARAQGFTVLSCAGLRSGSTTGFAGLHELLRPVLDGVEKLPPRQRAALEVVLGVGDGEGVDPLLLALAVLALIEDAAQEAPVLLLVDDLHWLDPSTADVLALLPRRLANTKALVVAFTRPVPDGAGREVDFQTSLTLTPLDASQAQALIDEKAPDISAAVRDRILRQSLGNPLALSELSSEQSSIAYIDGPLPVTSRIEQVFLAEANRLAPETRQAMLLAAAGEGAPAAEILAAAAASRLSQDDFAAAERARLLVLKDNRFSFRHPLIGSALYEAADFASRAAAHKVLATVTEDPARRTRHRAAATVGWDEEIARELDDAALKASRRGAKSEAVAAWRRAAELSPSAGARARRLVEAAEAARQGGDPQLCGRLLDEAQPAETDVATLLQFARTEWVLSMTADYRGRSAEQLLALAESFVEPNARVEVLVWAAAKCYILQEPAALRARVADAVASATQDETLALRDVALILSNPTQGFSAEALAEFRGEVDETHGILLNCLAFCAEELNDFALAELCWTTGVDLFHAAGRVSDEATAICGRSTVRLNRGRIDSGLEDAELALRLAQELNMPIVAGMAGAALARGRAMRGEHQAATSALSLVAQLPGAPAFARVAATTGWAAAIVAANDGNHGKAADELGRAMQYGPVALWAGAELAEAAIHAGRRQTLIEWLSMADAAAGTGAPAVDVVVARVRALLSAGPDAEDLFRASLEAGQAPSVPAIHLARTQLLYGEWLRRERRIVEAREFLSNALETFESHRLVKLADRAREELRAAGVRTASLPETLAEKSAVVAPLTSQELVVARLASRGMTNKEIADQMYLSHRTVGSHLRRAFSKLGVTRRSQLAGVVALRTTAA